MSLRLLGLLWLLALCACTSASGVYHTVLDGQTLYRISRGYGVDENYLARINGIIDPTRLQVGDLLYIPGAQQVRTIAPPPQKVSPAANLPARPPGHVAVNAAPPAQTMNRPPPSQADPPKTSAIPLVTSPSPATSPLVPPAPTPPAVVSGRFLWPLRGEVLRRFGGNGGATSKGMELAAAANAPIVAAAAGRVIYSGDGIRSYGNLIILKHDESFFTVYGYNERNLVQSGSFVSKGEKIAVIGTPPGGGRARLYFELRRGKEAVDPTIYLP